MKCFDKPNARSCTARVNDSELSLSCWETELPVPKNTAIGGVSMNGGSSGLTLLVVWKGGG